MQIIAQLNPLDNFIQSVKSDTSKREYAAALRRFIIHYKIGHWEELSKPIPNDSEGKEERKKLLIESCERILKLTNKQLNDILIDYVLHMKKQDRSEGYVISEYAAVKGFLSMNDIVLNWDKIAKYKGEFKKKQKDEAYSHPQIQQLLQVCDIRTRCIILTFCSTGIRVGALPELRLKHLKKVGDLYQFTIYEGYKEEYITFCTPECANAIENYLQYRKRSGEEWNEESPFIRQQFDPKDILQVKDPKSVSTSTIRNVLWNLLNKSGIREINHEYTKTQRKKIPEIHGFRKFFTSQLVNSNVNDVKRYLLEGHALKANDNSYVRVKDQLYDEYLKAIDNLTINEENRLKKKVEILTVEKAKVDLLEEDLAELKKLILGK
jgi:integrase